MFRRRHLTPLLVALMVLAARAETWVVTDGSEVVFTSKAPMESFDGRTDRVRGHLTCDPADLTGPLEFRLAVDLASLDTGIGLRNRHMREKHLETDAHPEAVFTGGSLAGDVTGELRPGATVDLVVRGLFELHGVTRQIDVPVAATMTETGGLEVDARFAVKLSDHEIDRPSFLVMKLADEQKVAVSLRLAREDGP